MPSYLAAKFRTLFLGKVLGIERRETVAVAWSFAYFFCVLSAYYILRPIRETMAVSSGSGTIPYLFVGTFTATLVVAPVFGWIVSRYPRRQFLPWVYLFFVSNILVFWWLFSGVVDAGSSEVWLGRAFFVWLSVFNLFVVSVFWSFMADIYTREQGRRLFGFIASGGSIGALIGGAATSYYVTGIGYHNLFPISAILLLVAVICITRLRFWVVDAHNVADAEAIAGDAPLGGSVLSGISHIFSSRYFLGIVASSLLSNLLGTALYMFAAQLVEAEIPGINERVRFFSNMNVAQNFLTLIAQMFLVRQVVARFGLKTSLAMLPALSILGYIVLAFSPLLGVVAVLTVLRRALGYGFMRPSTDMLYSVVTPEEKYKTKNFIDTAVWRGGDILGTWSVKLMMAMGLGITGVSVILLPFAAVWTVISYWLGIDYRRQARALKESGVA